MSTYPAGGHTLPPEEISDADAERIFDEVARRKLNISGDEFLRRLDDGRFDNLSEENPRIQEVLMLVPMVRATDAG